MGHPHSSDKSDKVKRIVAAVNAGRDRREVAAEFGVSLAAVKNYCQTEGTLDVRPYRGNEPRCRCGLMLPCTCKGHGLHAVDYMRGDGTAQLAFVGNFREF